jgi:hypothetical protein
MPYSLAIANAGLATRKDTFGDLSFLGGIKLPWSTENTSVGAGGREAGCSALADRRALELVECTDHPHHHSTGRSGCVDPLDNRSEAGARRRDTSHDGEHLLERPRQLIERPNDDSVTPTEGGK